MTGSADAELRAALAAAGLGVCAALGRPRWDARVPVPFRFGTLAPEARFALVAGSGGRALFEAFEAAGGATGPDPLDRYTERAVEAAAATLRAGGHTARCVFAHEAREGVFADFVALAREAGLGWASRLGLLLHPRYGPWWSLRAAVLTDAPLAEGRPLPDAGPCPSCEAPCARACPGAAVAPAGFDAARCGATRRREPACRLRCAARRACPVGAEHAYAERAEAHHMRASLPGMPGAVPAAGAPAAAEDA